MINDSSTGMHASIKVLPSLDNLELSCVKSSVQSGLFHKHYHEGLSFAVVTDGIGEFRFQHNSFKVGKGAIIRISPGEIHTSGTSVGHDPLAYRVFYVSPKLVKDLLNQEGYRLKGDLVFKEKVSYDKDFFCNCLQSHINLFETEDLLTQESVFNTLVLKLITRFISPNVKLQKENIWPHYLSVIVDYLQANYKEQVSLKDLSTLTGRSPSQILRSFQQYFGISPHAYLINLKIIEAKRLLAEGMSITQTALELGFTDQSHLHRYFQRFNHVTPGNYRHSVLN